MLASTFKHTHIHWSTNIHTDTHTHTHRLAQGRGPLLYSIYQWEEPQREARFMNINTIPNDLKKHQFNSQSRTILGPARLKETSELPLPQTDLSCWTQRGQGRLSAKHMADWVEREGRAREQRWFRKKSTKCLFQASWPSSLLADGTRRSTGDAGETSTPTGQKIRV